jgi:hypothetical protein
MSFFQTLDFDFADGFADPLAGVRLFGFQVNARGRLRQHDLPDGRNHFDLGLALEAHNDRIVGMSMRFHPTSGASLHRTPSLSTLRLIHGVRKNSRKS